MSQFNQPLFVIRRVGTQDFEAGYGSYAVPKLYARGSANSVVGRKNKEAAMCEQRWPDQKRDRWEAVPVTITLQEKT